MPKKGGKKKGKAAPTPKAEPQAVAEVEVIDHVDNPVHDAPPMADVEDGVREPAVASAGECAVCNVLCCVGPIEGLISKHPAKHGMCCCMEVLDGLYWQAVWTFIMSVWAMFEVIMQIVSAGFGQLPGWESWVASGRHGVRYGMLPIVAYIEASSVVFGILTTVLRGWECKRLHELKNIHAASAIAARMRKEGCAGLKVALRWEIACFIFSVVEMVLTIPLWINDMCAEKEARNVELCSGLTAQSISPYDKYGRRIERFNYTQVRLTFGPNSRQAKATCWFDAHLRRDCMKDNYPQCDAYDNSDNTAACLPRRQCASRPGRAIVGPGPTYYRGCYTECVNHPINDQATCVNITEVVMGITVALAVLLGGYYIWVLGSFVAYPEGNKYLTPNERARAAAASDADTEQNDDDDE